MRTLRFPRSMAPAPGKLATVESGGRRIGLAWVDGELYGLADACPHRGAPLCSAGSLVRRVESRDGTVVVRAGGVDRSAERLQGRALARGDPRQPAPEGKLSPE